MVILTDEVRAEIRALFTPTDNELSDTDVQEIADNLLSFALHIGGEKR